MKRTFIALLASTLIMLIYTPSIQASENNNQKTDRENQDKMINQPHDSGEQSLVPNLIDIDATDVEAQKEFLISADFNKEALGLVAEKQLMEKQASDGTSSKSSSLLNLQLAGLSKPLTGDVKLSLLGHSKEKDERASHLLDIEINDSPLQGTFKASVLGNEKKTTDTSRQTKRDLVTVELDNQLLGKANIEVLESQGENTDTYRSLRSSLATVNVKNSLIGKVNAAVSTHDAYESEDLSYRKGGLVSIEVKETLVGNVNVDVLKNDGKKTGILDVVTKDTPLLGNTDIHVGIDKPSFTAPDPKIPEQPIKKSQEPVVTERLEEKPENVVVPKNPAVTQENVVAPENPATPKQQIASKDSDKFPTLDFIDKTEVDQDGRPPVLNEVMEEQILLDKPVDDSLAAAIQKLLEAGNKQVLNNPVITGAHNSAINPAEEESKPIDNLYVLKTAMLGTTLSGQGASSSPTYSSANTGLGDLVAGKLNTIGYLESELSTKALFKVKTLQTKWNKEPPIEPPKQSSFLS